MARLDETKDGYNEWFDAAYDYADANLNLNPRTLASPAFERAARQAFDAGQDPYSFMSEYLAGEAEYKMGASDEMEEASGDSSQSNGFEEFLHMAQNHADDIGIKQKTWSSPGFEKAAKAWFDGGDDDWAMFAQEYLRDSQAWRHGQMESISLNELFGDRTDDEDHKSSGRKSVPPNYKDKEQEYKSSSDQVAPNKKSEKMSEAHGENAARKSSDARLDKRSKAAMPQGPRVDDFGDEPADAGFGNKDDQYLTGNPDMPERGEFDQRGGFSAGEEQGFEDPTSSKRPDGFGDVPEPSVDPEDDMWHGTDVDPQDTPGTWDSKGMPVSPDDDIDLDAGYDDDEPTGKSGPWSHYWDDRKTAKNRDDQIEPILARRGQGSKPGFEPRRKPKEEGMKQDRKHAADAFHADKRAAGDSRGKRREQETEFEPDEKGELKQSSRD